MNKQILTKGGAVLGVIILLISFTSAFAVSSKYWEDNALTIYPGEVEDFSVVLQNLAGTPNDVEVRGEITQGGDYVTFKDGVQDFSVPFGTKVEVPLSISVSRYIEVGEKFSVIISFKIKTTEESGAFTFGSSIEREIPVRVISDYVGELEPNETGVAIFEIKTTSSAEVKVHDLKLIIRAKGDSDSGDNNIYTFSKRAKFEVTKGWFNPLVAIGLLGFIGVLFYFKKEKFIKIKAGKKKK